MSNSSETVTQFQGENAFKLGALKLDALKLGKYQVQGILGEGGMGIVYKALDPSLDRLVAIKTIRKNLLEGKSGQELRRRFRREAQAEGRLVHPNIIAIYEYQEDEFGMPYFVMEYVEGKPLNEYLSKGMYFDLPKSLMIVEQILSALAYSHRRGIIHRDIKPANVILLDDDTIKIADFGIAKIEGSDFTQTGQIMGTPQYISPEQRMGKHIDARSDLYSTGAVLYELLTGMKALPDNIFLEPGQQQTSQQKSQLKSQQKSQVLNRLDTKNPATIRIYKQVVLKALAKDPEERFQNAEEFAEAIKRAIVKPKVRHHEQTKWLGWGGALGSLLLIGTFYLTEPGEMSTNIGPDGKFRVPRSTQITAAEQQKIDNQIKIAQYHVMNGYLILPEGINAYYSYGLVLDIDPKNAEALAGMEALQTRVVSYIESLIQNHKYDSAKSQLSVALKKFPNNEQLLDMQEAIKNL